MIIMDNKWTWINQSNLLHNYWHPSWSPNPGEMYSYWIKWVSDCCLLPQVIKFSAISWREQVTFRWDDDYVHFVLDRQAMLTAAHKNNSSRVDMSLLHLTHYSDSATESNFRSSIIVKTFTRLVFITYNIIVDHCLSFWPSLLLLLIVLTMLWFQHSEFPFGIFKPSPRIILTYLLFCILLCKIHKINTTKCYLNKTTMLIMYCIVKLSQSSILYCIYEYKNNMYRININKS